ncbi:MAG: VCBS repeat-containing protein, partial [Bacteroidia bacterium]|nr:VCBS repeat-containing protein [Bacteroidia bacterium]
MGRLVTWFVCLLPLHVFAQFTYTFDQSVPVTSDDDTPLSLPWAGGLNAAQYNALDIDGDGDNDLVLFDRMANKVITYVNTNNQYLYAPEFEALFPGDITNWILLRDFNCDGRKDIFTGDVLGIKVYTNETQPGGTLTWKRFRFYVGPGLTKSDVLLTKGFSGKINLQLQFDDLPSIADIDGDGDLDILNVKFTGTGSVEFHQNFSQERYGRCDSLDFERITQNYGGITECECGVFAFNSNSCTEPGGGRVEHAGGKALLSIDVDNDQNMDLVFSEASCTRLFLFHNEGTSANPVFTSAQDFPVTDPVNFLLFPAAYY